MRKLGLKGKMMLISLLPFLVVAVASVLFMNFSFRGSVDAAVLSKVLISMGVLIVVLLIVVTILVLAVVNNMVRCVNRLVGILIAMIKGDLTQTVEDRDLNRQDELGMFAKGVDKVRESLTNVVGKINQTTGVLAEAAQKLDTMADQTGSVAGEMAEAMNNMSSGALTQAETTQQVNNEVDSIGVKIEETNAEVEKLNQNSAQMGKASEEGVEVVRNLEEISKKVKNEIAVIHEQTNVTNESAQKIRQATELIASIASETNLLSLNASIEAARAGESGRGFAVVAEQIKNLSEQSNESVTSIDEIIGDLVEQSEMAVATMERVNEIIDRQSQEVECTKNAFEAVNGGLVTSSEEINRIADNTNTLEQSKKIVVDAMSGLSEAADMNATTSKETAAGAQELTSTISEIADQAATLHHLSEELTENISIFRI